MPNAESAPESRIAELEAERERLSREIAIGQTRTARSAVGQLVLRGQGIEIGGGATPFPLPPGATAIYGDLRSIEELRELFQTPDVHLSMAVDAQTFAGVPKRTQDFVIAAHVIEHLFDPIGMIVHAIRVLREDGVFVLAVPDMRYTFDVDRPETTVEHVIADHRDGGAGTRAQAYREHFTFVHPRFQPPLAPDEIERRVAETAPPWPDIHVHAWTRAGFEGLLEAAQRAAPFRVEGCVSNLNENIFVLRKRPTWAGRIGRALGRRRGP